MAREPGDCDVPETVHDGFPARLYPCGWKCDRHAPWARKGLSEPVRPTPKEGLPS